MKLQILIPLFCILLSTGCSKNDESSQGDGYPSISSALIEFLKSDGTSFSEGEIEVTAGSINSEGDVVYSDNWTPLQVFEEELGEIELPENSFGPIEVAGYHTDFYEEGEEWTNWRFYKFKYSDTEIIDTFTIKDTGVQGNGEYNREIEFFLNDKKIEPIAQQHSVTFLFQITKNEF